MLQTIPPLKSESTFDDDVILRRSRKNEVRSARESRTKKSPTQNRHSLFTLSPKLGSSLRSLSPFRHRRRRSSFTEHVSSSSSKCIFFCFFWYPPCWCLLKVILLVFVPSFFPIIRSFLVFVSSKTRNCVKVLWCLVAICLIVFKCQQPWCNCNRRLALSPSISPSFLNLSQFTQSQTTSHLLLTQVCCVCHLLTHFVFSRLFFTKQVSITTAKWPDVICCYFLLLQLLSISLSFLNLSFPSLLRTFRCTLSQNIDH